MAKKKTEATMTKYMAATLNSLSVQCERRGILPEELESVRAFIKKHKGANPKGADLLAMDDNQLKRLNRHLGPVVEAYLGGKKRREMLAPVEGPVGGQASGSVNVG